MQTRLYIANLPFSFNRDDMTRLFSKYGKIVDVYVPDKKGFGFLEMSNPSEALNVINNTDKKMIEGRKLSVVFAQKRAERTYDSNKNYNSKYKSAFRKNKIDLKKIDISLFVKESSLNNASEYVPQNKFSDFKISSEIKNIIEKRGFISPTVIQDKTIPEIIKGSDVIGIADTGTGKTAAFLIPLIDKIIKDNSQKVLIIAPTRELASQIRDELFQFSKGLPIRSALLIGGSSMYQQINNLRNNPNFIIGTPGRIKDLTSKHYVPLKDINNVVLDEVDRMLDMGFIEDIQNIFSSLPLLRQSLFFSATVPPKVKTLAVKLLKDPIIITVEPKDSYNNITQNIVKYRDTGEKIELLHNLLIKDEYKKVLIFNRTKRDVDNLAKELLKRGFKVESIHGDKMQSRRQKAIDNFKNNINNILVATDVAARGLDISDISHVINYEVPSTYEDYLHRIGRTGRANKQGSSITFVKV